MEEDNKKAKDNKEDTENGNDDQTNTIQNISGGGAWVISLFYTNNNFYILACETRHTMLRPPLTVF